VGSGAWSVRLWAPSGGAGAALGGAVRALSAAPLGVPGKALRLRRPGGYQARLRRPGNAVPSKTTHPLNIIDFTQSNTQTLRYSVSVVVVVVVSDSLLWSRPRGVSSCLFRAAEAARCFAACALPLVAGVRAARAPALAVLV